MLDMLGISIVGLPRMLIPAISRFGCIRLWYCLLILAAGTTACGARDSVSRAAGQSECTCSQLQEGGEDATASASRTVHSAKSDTKVGVATHAVEIGEIDGAQAQKLFLARYRELFLDKYRQDRESGAYYRCRDFPDDYEAHLLRKEDHWLVALEPPAGSYAVGRVDLFGKWVDITEVGFAPE